MLVLPRLLLAACISLPAAAAVLPDNIGSYHKTSSKPVTVTDRPVWDEYGLQDAETATYENAGKTLTATAYRLQDATSTLAAFDWQRPANSNAGDPALGDLSRLIARTPTGDVIAVGKYLLIVDGYHPTVDELSVVFRLMPRQQTGPLPTLPDYLPSSGLVPNSERYITGPASLALFEPEVTPAAAAFHFGTEVQTGLYQTSAGPMKMAIFSFPTPEAARQRATLLGETPGAVVKRTGPMVAVIFAPKDANAAEKLLAQVRYQASVSTQDKPANTKKENWGDFLTNLFILIGILLVFCVLSGVVFGGMFALFRRGGASGEGEAMTTLHLSDR